MMRLYSIILLSLLSLTAQAADSAASYQAQAVENSNLWPSHISVTEEVESNGKILRPGPPGVLMRVEGDRVLIDMGRRGVHWLPLEKTDFITQSHNKDHKLAGGNYIRMFGGQILRAKNGRLVVLPGGWHDYVEQLLFVYFDPEQMDDAMVEKMKVLTELGATSQPAFQVILMPNDLYLPRGVELLPGNLNGLSIVPAPLSAAYARSMDHHSGVEESLHLVLIDMNGKIIERPNLESFDLESGESTKQSL